MKSHAKAATKSLTSSNLHDALKVIAARANATIPKKEDIHLSAQMLRHTALIKAAEKDIRYRLLCFGVNHKERRLNQVAMLQFFWVVSKMEFQRVCTWLSAYSETFPYLFF